VEQLPAEPERKAAEVAGGSVVLFGSKVQGRFSLDTVLVVARSSTYVPIHGVDGGDAIDALVIDPLAASEKDSGSTFRLYEGATAAEPVDGMFSFVPCTPYDGQRRGFARPQLDLGDLLNHNLTQNVRCTLATAGEAIEVWQRVVHQVLDAGLVLGTSFAIPKGGMS